MSDDKRPKDKQYELTLIQRRLIDASEFVFDASPDEILFQHTVLCQTCLPYRNPGDERREWERANGSVRLKVIAGEALHPELEQFVPVGLPFGPKPRLIMAYLNAEAIRTQRPEIEVEGSLTAFVKRIGLDANGHSLRVIKDQLTRLSASLVRIGVVARNEHGPGSRTSNVPFVEEFDLFPNKDERQRVFWPGRVKLNPTYFESLQRHAVPLHPHALGALSHSAMGLDVYSWLAQRLHRVKPDAPQFVSWKALKDQFGWQYGRMDNFRRVFRDTLRTVLTQYPGAKIETDERGLTLHHSPPPVLSRKSAIIR